MQLCCHPTYGDEWEIQYCEKKYGKCVLNDLDSRDLVDMTKVNAIIDGRGHYTIHIVYYIYL